MMVAKCIVYKKIQMLMGFFYILFFHLSLLCYAKGNVVLHSSGTTWLDYVILYKAGV